MSKVTLHSVLGHLSKKLNSGGLLKPKIVWLRKRLKLFVFKAHRYGIDSGPLRSKYTQLPKIVKKTSLVLHTRNHSNCLIQCLWQESLGWRGWVLRGSGGAWCAGPTPRSLELLLTILSPTAPVSSSVWHRRDHHGLVVFILFKTGLTFYNIWQVCKAVRSTIVI